MNVVKWLGIALLCFVSVAVLLVGVVPAASLLLGLGIDIGVPSDWAPSVEKVHFLYSRPWVALLISLLLLALFVWGIWKLARA